MPEGFTATHHALMMAWISRAVVNAVGEKEGERIVRKAVAKYGDQRGRRMGMRAEANGHPLTMDNYLAYGEWKAEKGEMVMNILEKSPHARAHVLKCPWHKAWKENNLLPYGRFFCLEIDEALVKGFNGCLTLEINGTQTNGAEYCDFNFKDANLSPLRMLGIFWKKVVSPGKKAIMPWEYHVGHLYKTLGEVIAEELGDQAADIMSVSMKDFTDNYGEEAGRTVLSFKNTEFDRLP